MALKLRYETGIAATIQFIVMTLLNLIGGLTSSVGQCINGSGNCLSNIVLEIIYFIVITVWFGALWLAGFAAQDRRSRRIAQALIIGEGLVFLVGLYSFVRHHGTLLGRATGLLEFLSAAWVAWLAFRLILAKGGRVTSHHRARRRPVKPGL